MLRPSIASLDPDPGPDPEARSSRSCYWVLLDEVFVGSIYLYLYNFLFVSGWLLRSPREKLDSLALA